MIYRQPYYFLGQQDPGLPLKGRSQSVLDLRRYSCASPRMYARSPSPIDRYIVKESVYPISRSPIPPKRISRPSPSRHSHTKPIWIDMKTGRVVKGPEFLKGEKLIQVDSSSTSDSDESDTVSFSKKLPHITLEDRSPRQSPRRHSGSPTRYISPSSSRHIVSYRRTSPSRDYRYGTTIRRKHTRQVSPSSDSSSSSTTSIESSSNNFPTESSESETSKSSGYASGVDWRRYYNAQRLSPTPERNTRRIITLNPRSAGSPLRSLVPHHHSCGMRQNKCIHKGCHQRCGQCRPLENSSDDSLLYPENEHRYRQSVSRRSRATAGIVPQKPSSNLSFFEETILPGPNMPLKHFTPIRHSDTETYSDSDDSYFGPQRNYKHNSAYMRASAHGRLNDNLERWLNDAVKSTYSPPATSNCEICRGRAL